MHIKIVFSTVKLRLSIDMVVQEELDRDSEALKKELLETRLLAQKEMVLDPDAEMLEVSCLCVSQVHLV